MSWLPHRSEFTDTILSVHPSDVLDMPVDPNEPTYCLCHQVSYGEMIGCDNPDVSVWLSDAGALGQTCRGDGGIGLSLVNMPNAQVRGLRLCPCLFISFFYYTVVLRRHCDIYKGSYEIS